MFFRMLDGDRPYLGFFLSCIGNPADQQKNHSDNQQDKPDSESVHLRPPFPSIKRPRRRAAAEEKGETSRPDESSKSVELS
jgi:hypothetical protein